MGRRTPGNYVPLDVNYARDRAVRAAGPDAELLYVRALAYAKGARTKGHIPDYDLPVVAVGLKAVPRSVSALVRQKLWVEEDGGWRIRSWDPWNEVGDTRSESQSEGGRRGNHERWHVARSVTDPDCEWCTDIGPTSVTDSDTDVASDRSSESQGKGREGKRTDTSGEPDETTIHFTEFWAAYPRKTAKPNAVKAWAKAIKRADPETILSGLRRYRFATDPQFIPHPASWLNSDRWADEPAPAEVANIHRDVPPWEDFGPARAAGQRAPWDL